MPTKTRMLLRFNIAEEKEDALNEWYDNVHLPAIVACPGFISGRRFKALRLPTGPKGIAASKSTKYMTLYELKDRSAYETPEFQRARGFAEFAPFVSDLTLELFEEIKCIEKEEG